MATFGYEVIGTSATQNMDDRITGSVFTSGGTAGTGDTITVYISTRNGSDKYKCAIYLHSDLSLIGVTAEIEGGAIFPGDWNTFNFTGSPTILASTDYVLVCWAERGGPGVPAIPYDDGDGTIQGHFDADNYTGTFPDPLVPTHEDRKYSIHCDYTEEEAGTNIQINIGDSWKAVAGIQINIGDSWKAVAGAQINIGDAWKTIF